MSTEDFPKEQLQVVLVTDCGSTTTKALLFQKTDKGWRQTARGEAPTTVEEPVADVTVGALNAFTEVQEVSGRQILREDAALPPFLPRNDTNGIDLYLSTSSAGGGLQMMVTGIVPKMSLESAERAALGAGAIVLEAFSSDDEREDHEVISRIRHLRPDIVLMAGGVEGGSISHVAEMAEMLVAADPRPRFGNTLMLPVIFAGNSEAAEEVSNILAKQSQLSVVPNIRPHFGTENLGPAREAIHEFFLSHVMSHSPGYDKLLTWSPVPIMPTPAAVGDIVLDFATRTHTSVLCADIGGATTDVFSVFFAEDNTPTFNRTVSANLGMSYSIANVLVEAGVENIARWLPFELTHYEIRDRLRNKMIRPTSIPQIEEDLILEQAICREALRLSLMHHRQLAVGLSGGQQNRGIADIFSQGGTTELVDLMKLDLVIGSGGVLSHAPHRLQAAIMMIEGFGLEGVTQLTVDSIFMMPHLGVFSSVHPEAAKEIFTADCLVNIAHSIVPVSRSTRSPRGKLARVLLNGTHIIDIEANSLSLHRETANTKGTLRVEPLLRDIDVGNGKGQVVEREVELGEFGLICDGRNRPQSFSTSPIERASIQRNVYDSFGVYSL
ncbi:MAG: glutamate mutase L [Bdellovibrionales bacterium]|nr:glutamate mutase L [Bdellovibrionales bacterium]